LFASSVGQSKRGSPVVQPKLFATSKSSRKCAAYENSFFGMQPTLTQVPPKRSLSAIATRAPIVALTRLARTPPEPPPIVNRS
jgi:hypothetical protein